MAALSWIAVGSGPIAFVLDNVQSYKPRTEGEDYGEVSSRYLLLAQQL